MTCIKEGDVSNKERLERLIKKNEVLHQFFKDLLQRIHVWTIELNSETLVKADVIQMFFADSKFLKNDIIKKKIDGVSYYPLNEVISILEDDLMYIKLPLF